MISKARDFANLSIKRVAPTGQFGKAFASLFSRTIVAQVMNVAAVPLLAAMYMPEAIGAYSALLSLVTMLTIVGTFRFDVAIPLPRRDEHAMDLLILAFSSIVLVCSIVTTIVVIGPDWLMQTKLFTEIGSLVYLIPLGIAITAATRILTQWGIRKLAYKPIGAAKISQTGVTIPFQLIAGLFHPTGVTLAIGLLAGHAVSALQLLKLLSIAELKHRMTQVRRIRATMQKYRKHAQLLTTSSLLNSAALYLPSLIFIAEFGTTVGGFIAVAERIAGAPLLLIGRTVGQVYTGIAASEFREDPKRTLALYKKTLQSMVLVGGGFVGLLVCATPVVFPLIMPEDWQPAKQYIYVLAAMFFFRLLAAPLSQTLIITKQQLLRMYWEIARLTIVVGSIMLGVAFELGPLQLAIIYSAASTFVEILLVLLCYYVLVRSVKLEEAKG